MIVGTAGHIDHGKSALVRALTGALTDRLKEEQARGMTIDLGFAYLAQGEGEPIGFVDVPGHERFVRTMAAGAAGIDCALLVVAADDGIMPQTVEHAWILDLLGVGCGAAVVTKIDRVGAGRVAEVADAVAALLAPTALAGAPVLPVSCGDGRGLDAVRAFLRAAAASPAPRSARGGFRLAVDRSFALAGHGTVVTGTALAGCVRPGDALCISPTGIEVKVRAVHSAHRAVAQGRAGMRLALNLAGPRVEATRIARGDWVLDPRLHAPTDRLDCRLRWLACASRGPVHWAPVQVHLGCADVAARIALLGAELPPGGSAPVQLVLEAPVAACAGDRFIVRDPAARRTLGGGRVLDPYAPARGRARPERLAQLACLDTDDARAAARCLLDHPPFALHKTAFVRAWNLDAGEAGALAQALSLHAPVADWLVAQERWAGLREGCAQRVIEGEEDPRALCRALGLPRPVFDALVASLVGEGVLRRRGSSLAPAGAPPEAAPALWQAIEARLDAAGLQALAAAELARTLRIPEAQLRNALRALGDRARVAQTAPGRYLGRSALLRAAQAVEALGAGFALTQFRERCDCSRRAAVEILEYFDRIGFTRRQGELRTPSRRPPALS